MILIFFFNGCFVFVLVGVIWWDLVLVYGLWVDILFEINGCIEKFSCVFIFGISWGGNVFSNVDNYMGLV